MTFCHNINIKKAIHMTSLMCKPIPIKFIPAKILNNLLEKL